MSLSHAIAGYLDTHEYPRLFFKSPKLARLVQFVNRATTLRNWYVSRELRSLVAHMPNDFSMLDAGCGMGDFSIQVARMRPDARILGVDFGAESVRLADLLVRDQGLSNVRFESEDLVRLEKPHQFDLILCNAVLQSIQEDGQVLKNFHTALRQGGSLLLYVPVHYKRYLPGFARLEEKYLSGCFYGYANGFSHHHHTSDEIRSKLAFHRFHILKESYAYGFTGALSFEMYSLLLICLKTLPVWITPATVFLYAVLLYPLQLLLMLLDFSTARTKGNGFLVVARKA